ncbi:methyltransferase [Penicillium digitatum polymycoviruses 1]|uniref:Methyltransferase n=1 Tax=Penicillium digitatum polymycoviruses 1 TaxID=2164101 RepID=A0A2R4SUG2_9VIRU|nr:methyltransferase [Penicillium digitatum polymycoviruses 1]AVZ65985.1 methyltransferase [Penicillium digitatum polymycoviruses 1]
MAPKRFVLRGPKHSPIPESPGTPSLTERRMSVSSGGSYGGPSVRSRTVAGKSTRAGGVNAGLPYPIFEFGFPKSRSPPALPDDSQFEAGPADDYMRSPQGSQLRHDQGRYNAMLRQFIRRNTRVTGSAFLFLGSGSSRNMLKLLRLAPRLVVFVDVDKAALDRLRRHVAMEGLDANVVVEYVHEDAYTWLLGNAGTRLFDTVTATKCVGQILRGGRQFVEFADRVGGVMRHGGHFYVDHHVYATQFSEGSRLGDVAPEEEYNPATICGRYADDVSYSCESGAPDFELVGRFLSSASPSGVQVWELFCFRFTGRDTSTGRVLANVSALPPAPILFALPKELPHDPVSEAMVPVNAKGVKRIPLASDVRSHTAAFCTPKIDGEPGLLLLDGPTAVFISSRYRFVRPMKVQLSVPGAFVVELVKFSQGRALMVVTGVAELDGVACDPLDPMPLRHLEGTLDKLADDGIMVNSPRLMRYLKGDVVALGGPGQGIFLPVDGIQVQQSGRGGSFIKPVRFATVDAKQSEAGQLIRDAYLATGVGAVPEVWLDSKGNDDDVYEYSRIEGSHVWEAVRRRPDKQWSDAPGAVVHTFWASYRAEEYGFRGTVEDIRPRVAR